MKRIEDIDREFRELAKALKDADDASKAGDYQSAARLYAHALKRLESAYGADHDETSDCLINLINCHFALKNYAEAAPLLNRLWIQKESQLGREHPTVQSLLFKLAKCYEKLNMVKEAESAYRHLISVTTISDRSLTAAALESFAGMLRRSQGRVREADQYEEQARVLRDGQSGNLAAERLENLASSISPGSADARRLQTASKALNSPEVSKLRSLKGSGRKKSWQEYAAQTRQELERKRIPLAYAGGVLIIVLGLVTFWQTQSEHQRKTYKDWFLSQSVALTKAGNAPVEKKQMAFPEYKSADSGTQLVLINEREAKYITPESTDTGTYTFDDSALNFKGTTKLARFQKRAYGFVSDTGAGLYAPDSGEWKLIQTMQNMANDAQKRFQANGTYDLRPDYPNPFTQGNSLIRQKNTKVSLERLTTTKMEEIDKEIRDLHKYGMEQSAPGAVSAWIFDMGQGPMLFLKGTDRDGKWLRGTQPNSAFVISVINGERRPYQ